MMMRAGAPRGWDIADRLPAELSSMAEGMSIDITGAGDSGDSGGARIRCPPANVGNAVWRSPHHHHRGHEEPTAVRAKKQCKYIPAHRVGLGQTIEIDLRPPRGSASGGK